MANHKSAEKRARQTERRTAVNNARRSRVRGSIKKVEEAIKAGDKKAAAEALKAAQPEIQRGADRAGDRQERCSASRVATQCTHQGDGLKRLHSFRDDERRSAPSGVLLFCGTLQKFFRNFFDRSKRRSLGRQIGEIHAIRFYRIDATKRALDVEARHRSSVRRTSRGNRNRPRCQSSALGEQVESRADVSVWSVCARQRVLSKTRPIATGRGALSASQGGDGGQSFFAETSKKETNHSAPATRR